MGHVAVAPSNFNLASCQDCHHYLDSRSPQGRRKAPLSLLHLLFGSTRARGACPLQTLWPTFARPPPVAPSLSLICYNRTRNL